MVFVRSLGESSVEQLRRLLPRVEFLPFDPASDAPDELVDVVYRPYQVTDASDLEFLRRVGRRLVINQLDIIAFENPSYFGSGDQWLEYRNITRLALRLADGIAFLSGGVAQDARREGLIEGVKANSIVGCGLDLQTVDSQERRPVGLDHGDGGFLLCVGAAYHHKNRRFALSVWAELRRRGWMGRIVLAGPVPPHGNSLAQEAEFAIEHPHLRPGIVTLGRVSEAEKCWLYRRAALVLYPSTSEGFGLIPFEAARYNVPTLAPRLGGLEDFDSGTTPTLTGFDVDDAADGAWALLSDRSTADKACAAILDHAARYTWDDTATNLVGLFEETLRRPRCRDLSIAGDGMRPVGLTVPIRAPQRRVERMDALVRAVIARPALKRVVAPHGSARQRLARLVLSRLRSRLERVPR
jgi:glycosyltransferase involved in cell wall biosynthesis